MTRQYHEKDFDGQIFWECIPHGLSQKTRQRNSLKIEEILETYKTYQSIRMRVSQPARFDEHDKDGLRVLYSMIVTIAMEPESDSSSTGAT